MNETDAVMAGDSGSLQQPTAGDLPTEAPSARMEGGAEAPFTPRGKDQSGPRQRTVPYGALAEERARRKELQRELQGATEAQQRLQGRLDLLHELVQQRAASTMSDASQPVPYPGELQPEGQVEPPPMAEDESRVQADEAFRTQVMQSVREAMRDRPDFLAAYQHARQARVSELCALGYAPHEALEITFDNEREVIRNAYANGRNPAQVIYDYAQRHGYRSGFSQGIPNSVPPPSASRGAMTEAEKVALAARGQAASKSLSTAGGGSTGTLTLEALASMSDEEFAEATKGDRWQKLLG
jgi:hypothetical protein